MKTLLLTTITVALAFSTADASMATLDRQLVAIDYDIAGEGAGVGHFNEDKYQEIEAQKSQKVAMVFEPSELDIVLANAFKRSKSYEDADIE